MGVVDVSTSCQASLLCLRTDYVDLLLICNQVAYLPFLSQDAPLRLARTHDFLLATYSPLAQGKVMGDETLHEIAKAHSKIPVQIALRRLADPDFASFWEHPG